MKILFIGPTRIGDAVLSSGLLRHLVETHPGASITIVCGVPAAPLYEGVPNLERIIAVTKQRFARHWLEVWLQTAGTFWSLIVDMRRSLIPWSVLSRRRVIFRPNRSMVERKVVEMARTLGLENDPPAPYLYVPEPHTRRAEILLPEGQPVLAIGPAANWRGKTWPAERFVEMVERLTAAGGPRDAGIFPKARIAVFGGPDEVEATRPVVDSLPPDRIIDLVGSQPLLTVAACLARCKMYIGNDSGLMHMAAAMGTPTLGLFGPSRPEAYAPWGDHAAYVRTEQGYEALVGGPGYDHRRTDTLMGSLSVDAVVDAAAALWQSVERDMEH